MHVALLFLLACPREPADDDGEVAGGKDSGEPGDAGDSGAGDTEPLPDVLADMERSAEDCQEMGGSPDVQGAKLYYWGEFLGDEASGWKGEERWYLFVNDAWRAEGGADCVVSYVETATRGSAGACSGCDLGLQVQATLDASATDCPEGIYRGYDTMTETYGVARATDGTAAWHFAGSGDAFGAGYWNDAGLNYLAEYGCTVRTD
jgi:hypothetical protein